MFKPKFPLLAAGCTLTRPLVTTSAGVTVKTANVGFSISNGTPVNASYLECASGYTGTVTAATCLQGLVSADHTCTKPASSEYWLKGLRTQTVLVA